MPRPRRSDPWPSSSPTGSQIRGALGRIRRFATRRRLNVRRPAGVAPFARLYPIDRSSRLVGPINPDREAALAQPGERGPRRVRQPAGGGDKLGERRAVAALQQFDDLRDFASLRGDIALGATPLFGSSMAPARSKPDWGIRSTQSIGWSAGRTAPPSDGPVSSTVIAFAPAAVSLSAKVCPVSSSRRQIGAPALALISFTRPAWSSLAAAF